MKQKLLFLFNISFATLSFFHCSNSLQPTDCLTATKKMINNVAPSNYDIETLDIYGNHQFYNYDDFEYEDDVFVYSLY